jgi:hypothetical protein
VVVLHESTPLLFKLDANIASIYVMDI